MLNILDGQSLKKLIISGANNLENNKKMVDDLNVFPVPDGDTGTNMSMTINAAARDLISRDDANIHNISEHIASSSLRGARGNSGVILSQLFRGFSRALKDKKSVNTIDLAFALKASSDTAYKAVMKPTEGTILTVARETATYAVEIAEDTQNILEFAEKVLEKARETLNRTPDMLPVLKQANVVDAGGMGLVVILEGAISALKGNEITRIAPVVYENTEKLSIQIDTDNIKFIYCTEFIITKKSLNYSITPFREVIEQKGDSILVIEDADIVKVHIHTNKPGFVLEQAVKIGDLSNIKIDNMKLQHNEATLNETVEPLPQKEYGIVAVTTGEGIEQIFKDVGTDGLVMGGQSMNPSTEDILKVINKVNSQNIFVLPNNKNIILAAGQVNELTDKNVIVIPTKTIPQGIGAMLAFDKNAPVKENINNMGEAISQVKTGLVTFAARDSEFDGMSIKSGDIMGMEEDKITIIGDNPNNVAAQIIAKLVDKNSYVITLLYGEDIETDVAKSLLDEMKILYPKCDIMLYKGGQPLYYYIISVE